MKINKSSIDSVIRIFAGVLLLTGGILMFSAVYDRCPIWKAITTQFKKVMAK